MKKTGQFSLWEEKRLLKVDNWSPGFWGAGGAYRGRAWLSKPVSLYQAAVPHQGEGTLTTVLKINSKAGPLCLL